MTPNILAIMGHKFDHGDPLDYTWVDLGGFGSLEDDEYDRVMDALPDLFFSDPEDAMLPFEAMGIVRRAPERGLLAVTIERHSDGLFAILRTSNGDAGSAWNKGNGEHAIQVHGQHKTAQEYVNWLQQNSVHLRIKEDEQPETYIYQMWAAMVSHQYAEYMRRAVDMPDTAHAYKATLSRTAAKRMRKGKKPLYDWTVIDVTAKHEAPQNIGTGNARQSPRQHKRRGHFRQYRDGRRTWIKEMLVGRIEFGYIHHSYTTGVNK